MVASVLPATSTQAAVVLEGTRIVHDAGKGRDVTIRSTNTGDQAALTQVWMDDGDSQARPESVRTPFRLTPSEPRLLNPQQGQAWRISYAPRPSDTPLPTDRESLFYFNLLDIPPKPPGSGSGNLLQFAVRSRIKLFHRPAGLRGMAEDAAESLVWSCHGPGVRIYNPSAYHVTISTITLGDGAKVDGEMVAPGGERVLPHLTARALPGDVLFTWLDDYGASRETKASIGCASAGPAGEDDAAAADGDDPRAGAGQPSG